MLRQEDEEAAELLEAKARRAYRDGLAPEENNSSPGKTVHPSHRCPVGDHVNSLADSKFKDGSLELPWAGELYAEGSDSKMLYRLYFVERRPTWSPPSDMVVGSGVGRKPIDNSSGWTPVDQTREIHDAMYSGVTFCRNTSSLWRRWNTG